MADKEKYFIPIEGKLIEVEEEVYVDYYRMNRRERYLEERDKDNGVFSYDALDGDKSTFAAYLAGFLADACLKTLLVDADYSQPTASSVFALQHESPCGLYELLMQMVSDHTQCISQTAIKNLDVIYSNDPDELLPTAMLHAADGRLRLRNILQHPFFNRYDVIIVDSKGATGL